MAKRTNLHRHSVERAVVVLSRIGLIRVEEADANADYPDQIFTINSLLLQNPPMDLEGLVQKLDQVRKDGRSKKETPDVQLEDRLGPKLGPTLMNNLKLHVGRTTLPP